MAPICSYYFTLSTFVLSLALFSGSESKSDSSLLPQFEQHPVNQTKELRESAIFKCRTRKVENVPKATIIWFKNDRKVTGFEATQHYIITSEGDLVIQGVRGDLDPLKSDEGEYFCRAENSHGSTESTHAFLVIYSMGETFKVSPQNSSVQIGQSTLLQCEPPESHPRSKVTWLKDGVYIDTKNDDHFSLVGHNLAVQKAEGIHSGQYVCVATNGHHKKLSRPATLHVGTQPFFTKQLKQHYSAAEGESIILECRASGTPPPEIFWTKADFIRIDENSPKYIVKRGSLQIMNLAQSDGGSYACIASNDIQSIKSQTTVLVAGRKSERPGFLKTPPSQTTVPKGDDVTLPCQPRDFNTEVFWSLPQNHKTSALVKGQSTGRISVTDLGSLVIKQAKVEDSGQYRCSILALEGGDNSVTVDVTVKQPIVDPPPLIDIEPYNQSVGVGADVLLPCYAEGSSSLPTIHWTFNSRPLSGNDRHLLLINGSLHVINTKPEDSGIYTCTAYNVFGETSTNANLKVTSSKSGQSEHAISVDYLPPPPNFFSVSKIGLTDVELMWFPAYFQDPQISISYRVDFYSDGLGKWKSSWTDFRADRKPNEPVYFKLEGLSLSSRHLFTVRSCNYIGCGRTVQLHYKVQLLGSSALDMHSVEEKSDKFEVELFEPTVINSTFAVLSWRVISNPASVMNFAIDVDDEFSPAWHTDSKPVLTKFLDRNQRNFAIANLKAASKYNITITTKLNTGVLITRRQSVQTLQAPPSAAPDHVTAMLNGTKIQISWMPPQADYVNGILTGYVILVYNEKGLSLYNISTGNVTHSLIELESNRHHKVIIRVAARSMAPGIGVESDPITLTFGKPPGSFTWDESYTWILAVLGVFVWVMLIVLAFVITKRWFNNYKQSPPIKYRKTPMKQLYHESDVSNLTVESEMFISAPVGDQIEFMSKDPIPSWLRGNQHQVNSRVFTPFYSSATLKQAATAGATPFTVSSTTPSTLKVYKQSVLTESSTSQEPQLIIPSQNYNIPSQILHPLCEFSDSNPFLNCHQNTTGTRSSRLLQLPARPCQTQSGSVPASDPSHDKSFTSLVHKTSSSRSSNNSPSLPDESCKYCQGAVSDKHQPAGFPDASGIHIGKPDQDSSFVTTSHYASVDPVFYCDNYTALELCVNGSN